MLHAQSSFAQDFLPPVTEFKILNQAPQDEAMLVLVVEPIPALRNHLTAVITLALPGTVQVVESAPSDTTSIVAKKTPVLVVIDFNSHDREAIEKAREFWRKYPETRILFWCNSFRASNHRQIQAILPPSGVFGVIHKSCTDDRLKHAIQSLVIHENTFIDSEVRRTLQEEPVREDRLSKSEYETLCDVLLGLTDKAIAKRRNLSARGVQNRLAALFSKVLRGKHSWLRESAAMDVYNLRTRLIFEVIRRGLVDTETMSLLDDDLDSWIGQQFGM